MEWTAAIGIGSNVGDRSASIARAVDALRACAGVRVVGMSSVVETPALRAAGAGGGAGVGGSYLNAVVLVRTSLAARGLLDVLLEVERSCGRDRSAEGRWGARTLDLDVLLYGDAVIREAGLEVPHPRMCERWFVLAPLAELAGEFVVPGTGRSVRALLSALEKG